jgi:ABC-type multidrug transport system fused ATPase/permease subunit
VVDGHLVELGPHDELVGSGGHYSALYDSWAGGVATPS